jgi:hypothetical protein
MCGIAGMARQVGDLRDPEARSLGELIIEYSAYLLGPSKAGRPAAASWSYTGLTNGSNHHQIDPGGH